MRALKILALAVIVALVVAGVASAKVRDGMTTVAETAEDVLSAVTDPSPSATPIGDETASPAPTPSTSESAEPLAEEPPAEPEMESTNHGAAVSAVARDKEAVGTWTNPAGKVITNHGKAVSDVAKPDAGKNGADDGDGEAAGKAGKDK